MRKRRWQVELRAKAKSDGLDRLGRMVQLLIDHAVVARATELATATPARHRDAAEEPRSEEMLS